MISDFSQVRERQQPQARDRRQKTTQLAQVLAEAIDEFPLHERGEERGRIRHRLGRLMEDKTPI